jgi:hypothetical protein
MSNFDITQFEASDTATMPILDPKGEPVLVDGKPASIELYGPGSAEYTKAQAALDSALTTRGMAALRGKPTQETPEEQRKLIVAKLASCTKALNNFPIEGGAQTLYMNPRLGYITNQVTRFIEDWANFTCGSAKT